MPTPRRPTTGILAGPVAGPEPRATDFPRVDGRAGLRVLHRPSGFTGDIVEVLADRVTLVGNTGPARIFANRPGTFAVDGAPVRLVAPARTPGSRDPDRRGPPEPRVTDRRTASGSRAVIGARARVARTGRILVEGVHDAELVERVWGDDLRLEGVVVERLDGADHLADALAEFGPGPGRRVGVLLDHLVAGTKEVRLARAVAHPQVLVTGTPFVDVWQAVRPRAVGIAEWPDVPRGTDWKTGVCTALCVGDPRAFWRRILGSVTDWTDLEQPLVRAVEELIDFVTADQDPTPG